MPSKNIQKQKINNNKRNNQKHIDEKYPSIKQIFGWCMFDFANSSYTTVIITVVFGPIFTKLIVPNSNAQNNYAQGNQLWALALALSYVLVAFLGPLLGTISDKLPLKKKFLFASYLSCVIFTSLLWFVKGTDFYLLAFFLLVLSNFSFSIGENFCSAFLPFLGSKENLGKLSGYAWSIGYFGGIASVIFVRLFVGETKAENFETLRWVGPLTALFFLVAGIPTFALLKEPKMNYQKVTTKLKKNIKQYIQQALVQIKDTFILLRHHFDLSLFFISLFFALSGLSIIISFTFIYGNQEIGLSTKQETITFVLVNLSAALGALIFGFIQDRKGPIFTFNSILVLWVISVLFLYFIKKITLLFNQNFNTEISVQTFFMIMGSIAGLGLGATQSAGRAIVGLFAPENQIGKFYGFWGISGKLAAAFGLLSIGYLQKAFGLQNAILVMVIFFSLALFFCLFVNEKRALAQTQSLPSKK